MTNKRLEFAVRSNEGRRVLPSFQEQISEILKRPVSEIQLADLAKTDEILGSFKSNWALAGKGHIPKWDRTWPADEMQKITDVLKTLEMNIPEIPMHIYRRSSEYCGAVQSNSKEVLRHAINLTELDDEDLIAVTDDQSGAIFLSHCLDRYDGHSEEIYHMVVMGPQLFPFIGTIA